MTSYPVRSRGLGRFQWVILVIWYGAIFAMTVLPILNGSAPRAEWAGRIGGFAVFVIIGVAGSAWDRRKISEFRVAEDGVVQVVRGNGRIATILARDIRELEGGYSRDYDGDYTIWNFTIHAPPERFKLGEFDNLMDFVEWVRIHHPDVAITGHWPLGAAPPPSTSIQHLR